MNSASVDLIYLDPPFNSKANYAAPIGSKAAGAAFTGHVDALGRGRRVDQPHRGEARRAYRVLLAAMTSATSHTSPTWRLDFWKCDGS